MRPAAMNIAPAKQNVELYDSVASNSAPAYTRRRRTVWCIDQQFHHSSTDHISFDCCQGFNANYWVSTPRDDVEM